jgi:hypothetical protein
MYIDDCVKGIDMITHSDVDRADQSRFVRTGQSINRLVDITPRRSGGVKLKRNYKLDAPRASAAATATIR